MIEKKTRQYFEKSTKVDSDNRRSNSKPTMNFRSSCRYVMTIDGVVVVVVGRNIRSH
jgi:hypothetical protein